MTEEPSAWNHIVADWVEAENGIRSEMPILGESTRVRDAIQHCDNAFILVSYDVAVPWPSEEDTPRERRGENNAVICAKRVRTPWMEYDNSRAALQQCTADGEVRVYQHMLGGRLALTGYTTLTVEELAFRAEISGSSDEPISTARVIDGWFITVVSPDERPGCVSWVGDDGVEVVEQLVFVEEPPRISATEGFKRDAGRSHYFSPLDLRAVYPLVRWQRSGRVTAVAVCVEKYDKGGILRIRLDGIMPDDDLFLTWPEVRLDVDGELYPSAVYGEYRNSDTVSMDIGFKPWRDIETSNLTVELSGLRGASGVIEPLKLELALRAQ